MRFLSWIYRNLMTPIAVGLVIGRELHRWLS